MRQAPAAPAYHCGQPKPVRSASRATANTRCPRAVRAAEFARGTHTIPKAITSGSGRGSSCLAPQLGRHSAPSWDYPVASVLAATEVGPWLENGFLSGVLPTLSRGHGRMRSTESTHFCGA
ncbi:unnamed protein product, partial [Ixodes pacificus]